jgi:hypothetical protein
MSRNEIWPCIAHISPNTLEVRPILFGRGPGFYGYRDLLNYLREFRVQAENNAANTISVAIEVEARLKKSTTIENSIENVQQQIMPTGQGQNLVMNQEQVFPIELMTQIFEYLEPIEIVKTVMATSRLWRAIGLEVIVMGLRREIKSISESLVTYPRTAINKMPYYSRIIMQKDKLVGIYELNQRIKNLIKLLKILDVS